MLVEAPVDSRQPWLERLRMANSYNRITILIGMWHACVVEWDEWLRLLGEEWSGCDNIGEHLELLWETPLGEALEGNSPAEEMMDDAERAALAALPDRVTIYRGCYAINKWGLSWSTNRETAESFPFLNRYRQEGQPLLVKATVDRSKIVALKHDRGEFEVITWRPRHVSSRHCRETRTR